MRRNVDFTKHELTVKKNDLVTIYTFGIPGSSVYRVNFINCMGVMLVTGDLCRWSFCRSFFFEDNPKVSDHYWCEKIGIGSNQEPYVFDPEATSREVPTVFYEEFEDIPELKEQFEQFAADQSYTVSQEEYTEQLMDLFHEYDVGVDPFDIPTVKAVDNQLQIIFDAWEIAADLYKKGIYKKG